jgi:hypothetical protein
MRRGSTAVEESGFDFSLDAWISGFLSNKPLTSVRKVTEWRTWARAKLKSGWSSPDVRSHIERAWKTWEMGGNIDTVPMEPELMSAVADVFHMAESGSTPAQCAVVYRSLYREYPTRFWLHDWAERWESAGDDWQKVKFPERP